jgi:hypothetical protein
VAARDYAPTSLVIDSILIVEGVGFAVFPGWSIMKSEDLVRLDCLDDERVYIEFVIGPVTEAGVIRSQLNKERRVNLKDLGSELSYEMVAQEGGGTALLGVVVYEGRALIIKGFFFEDSEADKRRAGQLWQMVNWIHLDRVKRGKHDE